MTVPQVKASNLPINSVRAYKGATPLQRRTFTVYETEVGRLVDVDLLISKGRASQGYRSDFDKVQVFWVESSIPGPRGRRVFGRCYRGSKAEQRAWGDFREAVQDFEQATEGEGS